MVELRFRIRNGVFRSSRTRSRRTAVRAITLSLPTLEEAALLGEVDESGRVIPCREVFLVSFLKNGPVIEGFVDCALGEFVRAQLEALSPNGEPPERCEMHGTEPFLEILDDERSEKLRDLISVCEFRVDEFTPESAIRFLKESGFLDQFIIVGVKHGKGWRRSRCITTFEGQALEAATVLGYLAEYFGRKPSDDKQQDDQHM